MANSSRLQPYLAWSLTGFLVVLFALACARVAAQESALIGPISLTADEESWIRDHPKVRVHFEPWPPFLMEEDGRPVGLTVDYIELIFGELGIEVEWVRLEWAQAIKRAEEGRDVDVLPLLTHTQERESFLSFTADYLSFPIVIFTRQDSAFTGGLGDLRGRTLVVERDFTMHARLQQKFAGEKLMVVDTTGDALEAVATGSADAYLGNLAVGTYIIQEQGFANLKVAAPAPFGSHDQAIGVRRDLEPLSRILDKGLAAVSDDGHHALRQRWLALRYEHGIRPSDVVEWILTVVLVAGLLLVVIVVWNRRLKRENLARERSEIALRESTSRLLEAERLAGIGSWSSCGAGECPSWSPESYRIFGRDPDGPPPRWEDVGEAVVEDDREAFAEVLEAVRTRKARLEVEFRLRRADGTECSVICRGAPGAATAQCPSPYVGTVQDVTEARSAAAEQERLETSMRHAQKLESLGVMAGGIAHDFNNILTTILGNTELVLPFVAGNDRASENLLEVINSSRRAADLCQQMLAYAGRGRVVQRDVDLSRLARGIADMLSVSLSKKANLQLKLGESLPRVYADRSQLQQVIMNLVTNASEALDGRSGDILLTTRSVRWEGGSLGNELPIENAPAGTYVVLEVRDTGAGMSEATRAKLFDPFFTTKFSGRGLGMSVVLGIVRRHRGAITIESAEGRGTTFTVTLPASTAKTVLTPPPRGALALPPPSGGFVLVVDDELKVLATTGRMLAKAGFRVLSAENGNQALAVFDDKRDEIMCVLLDMTMPELDGVETFSALRELDPNARIILCSGYHEDDVGGRFEEGAGPSAFLQKPFSFDEMLDAIAEISGPDKDS